MTESIYNNGSYATYPDRINLLRFNTQIAKNLTVAYNTTICDTTDSISSTTGGLVVKGGLGVEKKMNLGSDLAVNTNKFTVASGTGNTLVAGTLGVTGIATLSSTTDSSSTTTGGLIVSGGLGVEKKMNIGNDVSISENLNIVNTSIVQKGIYSTIQNSRYRLRVGTINGVTNLSSSLYMMDDNNDFEIQTGAYGVQFRRYRSPFESGTTVDTVMEFIGTSRADSSPNVSITNNLGIGTTAPTQKLQVEGKVLIQVDDTSNTLTLKGPGNNNNPVEIYFDKTVVNTTQKAAIGMSGDTARDFFIWVNGSDRLNILDSGNVGIGTTTPSKPLHVNGKVLIGSTEVTGGGTNWTTGAQLHLGGAHNSGTDCNFSTGTPHIAKLLISSYNNDESPAVYPIVCQDENGSEDFYVRAKVTETGGCYTYIGGECNITQSLTTGLAIYQSTPAVGHTIDTSHPVANSSIHITFTRTGNYYGAISMRHKPYNNCDGLAFYSWCDGGNNLGNGVTNGQIVAHIVMYTDYGVLDFTGQHRNVPADTNLVVNNNIGKIVCANGEYATLIDKNVKYRKDAITINDALPKIVLSTQKKQKTVFGVISNEDDIDENKTVRSYGIGAFKTDVSIDSDDTRIIINAVGEGAIWIVNTNGNLENGDYIQSSDVEGLGEKQDDDILHNYTVAKITCDCNFTLNSDDYNCVEFVDTASGNTYKKAFIGCTYHCG